MSTTKLTIIPNDPNYVPSKAESAEALILCRNFKINTKTQNVIMDDYSEDPNFHDCGDGLQSILCPLCRKSIDIEQWSELMDIAYGSKFNNLSIITPCCNERSSLNDLVCDAPMGFSKYSISFSDVEYQPELIDLKQLESILKCSLRMIWAHY